MISTEPIVSNTRALERELVYAEEIASAARDYMSVLDDAQKPRGEWGMALYNIEKRLRAALKRAEK